VTEHRSRPAGKNSGKTPPVQRQSRVPDGVHAAIDAMKAPSLGRAPNRAFRVPEDPELVHRNDSVLLLGQPRKRSLALQHPTTSAWLSFLPHMSGKLNHAGGSPPDSGPKGRCEHEKSRRPEDRRLGEAGCWES
jgi:hypothetical protein